MKQRPQDAPQENIREDIEEPIRENFEPIEEEKKEIEADIVEPEKEIEQNEVVEQKEEAKKVEIQKDEVQKEEVKKEIAKETQIPPEKKDQTLAPPQAKQENANPRQESAQEKANANENLGYLIQICAGKQHILHLTEDGHVYSYGSGVYGVCGQGGAACCFQHQILRSLSERNVIQIACGEYHSLALTQSLNIYSWGRGFEGQLGITQKKHIEIASKPTFIPFFDKLRVKFIAAGSYYSLAITEAGDLYGWGEARLGQLGCGKQRLVFVPQKIVVCEDPEDVMRKTHSSVSLKEATPRSANPNLENTDARVRKVAAGFGHTAAITEDGQLFVWGLNVFGQLGIGVKMNTSWKPVRVEKDITNNWLPKVKDVACGFYFTFMIDGIFHL